MNQPNHPHGVSQPPIHKQSPQNLIPGQSGGGPMNVHGAPAFPPVVAGGQGYPGAPYVQNPMAPPGIPDTVGGPSAVLSQPLPGAGPAMDPGTYIDIPYFLPLYNEAQVRDANGNPVPVVPRATAFPNPRSFSSVFQVPRSPFGDFTFQGWWAMWAAINEDPATNQQNPLVWVDPDTGVISDALPSTTTPPDFIGAQEGYQFDYNVRLAGVDVVNDIHSHTNMNLLPLVGGPYRVQAGGEIKLTVIRSTCQRFFPNTPLYLFCGLFGALRYLIPPPYKPDACSLPVKPISVTSPSRSVAGGRPNGGDEGTMSVPAQTSMSLNNQHPTDIGQLNYAGAEHMYCKVAWQGQMGTLSNDYIPARLFKYAVSGGVLPQVMKLNAPTKIEIEMAQPIVVTEQFPATGRWSCQGGAYGY